MPSYCAYHSAGRSPTPSMPPSMSGCPESAFIATAAWSEPASPLPWVRGRSDSWRHCHLLRPRAHGTRSLLRQATLARTLLVVAALDRTPGNYHYGDGGRGCRALGPDGQSHAAALVACPGRREREEDQDLQH